MSLKLLSDINDNFQMAIAVHKSIADAFFFIGLEGYSLWHEFQHLSENMTQREVKRYITRTYQTIEPDKLPKTANIIEPFLSGKNRKEIKMDFNWKLTKDLFFIYQEWEESTIDEYQKISKKLMDNGETSAFNFVQKIIKDVKIELDYLNDKITELNGMDWDMATIIDQQDTYVERYEYLIHNLLGKSREYHHFNSNVDAESRISLLDKYSD